MFTYLIRYFVCVFVLFVWLFLLIAILHLSDECARTADIRYFSYLCILYCLPNKNILFEMCVIVFVSATNFNSQISTTLYER